MPSNIKIGHAYPRHFTTITTTTLSRKNVPPLTCYNHDIHDPITIMVAKSVTKKVRNQTMLCFPTTTLRNRKPRNCIFSLQHCLILLLRTHSVVIHHLWH